MWIGRSHATNEQKRHRIADDIGSPVVTAMTHSTIGNIPPATFGGGVAQNRGASNGRVRMRLLQKHQESIRSDLHSSQFEIIPNLAGIVGAAFDGKKVGFGRDDLARGPAQFDVFKWIVRGCRRVEHHLVDEQVAGGE